MDWIDLYSQEKQPTAEEIAAHIDNPLWAEFNDYLQENYGVEPDYSYSGCAGQPGWNVKYKKGGKSLCTLYPMDGYFIALVVVGNKEVTEVELIAPSLTDHVQELLNTAGGLNGARWLMIHVTDEDIMNDALRLIEIRKPIRRK